MTENEYEGLFELKQLLTQFVFKDIEKEWEIGNIPNIPQKIEEIKGVVNSVIEDIFTYLKELGKIFILPGMNGDSDLIIETTKRKCRG